MAFPGMKDRQERFRLRISTHTKYSSANTAGYPDRVALLPGGRTIWIELKSKGKKPTKLQTIRIDQLASLGHQVFVADSKERINEILEGAGYDL